MRTTMSESNTFLTHTFGQGLEDERYAVERFKSTMDGEIRSVPAAEAKTGSGRRTRRATATRKAVREMRPARDEIIVCTGLRTRDSGVQYWGVYSIGLFGRSRRR
ncbi:MAG: hypothetical protein OXL41_09450 [Nitrospinae bacterium]|nr:hypothetical protein [Nitrospinota bacterium]